MTSILDRLTGTDEPEEPMTIPRHGSPSVPGASQVPWWRGVPGLDPDVRYADWVYAAECAAIACGIYVLGVDAGRADWLRGHMRNPVKAWVKWLTGGGEADAPKRALTLRLLCERADAIHPDNILHTAEGICSAGTLR